MTSYNGIPYSNENKQAIATCNNMCKSHVVHKNQTQMNIYIRYKRKKILFIFS